jgi:REP element-mobilizing transposase RayT
MTTLGRVCLDTPYFQTGGEMPYDPRIHHRRSIRLQNYDYSQPGAYFVTICVQDRACLFGDVVDGEMRLNDVGVMVQTVWDEIPANYPGVDIDAFVIMPNHFHGIVVIVGAGPRACPIPGLGACPMSECAEDAKWTQEEGRPRGAAPTGELSLADVVHRFKTMTTKRYVDGVRHHGWQSFPGRLWQRNYWEHIVPDESELNRIREYIANNPGQWEMDRLYPGLGLRETPVIYGGGDPRCADDADWMV